MNKDQVFHALWIGGQLSRLEQLTLVSFVTFGHSIHLWHYEPITPSIPVGVQLRDANEIIPRQDVFTRRFADPVRGIGMGSFGSPFSDLFRYRLLHLLGGWWIDMDVTCLRRIDFAHDYFFRSHHSLALVGNIMTVPKGCPVLHKTFEEVSRQVDENTLDWMLPNRVLATNVVEAGLSSAIFSGYSNADEVTEVDALLYGWQKIEPTWWFVHWCNERMRVLNFAKNEPPANGELERLMQRFGV